MACLLCHTFSIFPKICLLGNFLNPLYIKNQTTAKTLQAARDAGKLPDFKALLHAEYKELTEKKDELCQEYGKSKKTDKQYDTLKQNS